MQQINIKEKINSARILGFQVAQEFSNVNGTFFMNVHIKDEKDTVLKTYPIPVEKELTLTQLRDEKTMLQERITKIDEDIAGIEAS